MKEKEDIIKDFINNFIQKDKTERTFFELNNPKKRHKFTNRLNHTWDKVLKMNLLYKLEKQDDNETKIKQILTFKDDDLCYIISNYADFDDQIRPFKIIFDEIYGKGLATMLINIESNMVFLETEFVRNHTERFIGQIK